MRGWKNREISSSNRPFPLKFKKTISFLTVLIELVKLWNMKVAVILIVVGQLGRVLKKRQTKKLATIGIKTFQKMNLPIIA